MSVTASEILNKMYLEKLASPDRKKVSKGDAIAAGSIIGGGIGVKALHDRGFTTGRETLYHNTDRKNVKGIFDKGILGSMANKPGSITRESVEEARKNPGKFKDLTYMSRSRGGAFKVGVGDVMSKDPIASAYKSAPTSSDVFNTIKDKKTIKGRVPTWKMNLTKNPEISKFRDANHYADEMADGFLGKTLHKGAYKNLDKGTATFKGDVPPEYLKGSKHYKKTNFDEIKDFAKNNPKKFAVGVAGTAAGAAAIGLGARHFYKKRKAKKEEEKMDKSASQILDAMCMEKTAGFNKEAAPSWVKPAAAIGGAALGAGALGAGAGYMGSKRGNEIAKAARNELNGANYKVDPKYADIFDKNTRGKRMQATDILLSNDDGEGRITLTQGDLNDIIKLQRRANDYEERYSDRPVDIDPKGVAMKTGLGVGALGAGLAGAGMYAKNRLSKRAYDELTDAVMEKTAYDRYMEKVASNPNFMSQAAKFGRSAMNKGKSIGQSAMNMGKNIAGNKTVQTGLKRAGAGGVIGGAAAAAGSAANQYMKTGNVNQEQVKDSSMKGAMAGTAIGGLSAARNAFRRTNPAASATSTFTSSM